MEGVGARVSILVGECRPKQDMVNRSMHTPAGKLFAGLRHVGDFVWCLLGSMASV